MWQSIHDAWWRLATLDRPHSFPDALACRLLDAGAAAFKSASALRNLAYDRGWARSVRLPCRVVSIGNLTVGGTGKTACVELIASKLARLGRHPAVLSRGYGGSRGGYWVRWERGRLAIHPSGQAAHSPAVVADEPQLLAAHLPGTPVVVGARRDEAGRFACSQLNADTLVLDDGFQHRRLARDFDIVLINARMPLSGWPVLPRGPMREPLTSLRRAHALIITKADESLETIGALGERLKAFNRDAALASASHAPVSLTDPLSGRSEPLKRLDGARVALLSSIGDPAGFEATVRRLHAEIAWHRQFPDHHVYRPEDWQAVASAAASGAPAAIVTTEKDWVRLEPAVRGGPSAPVPG